jgi:hypothetical protein
VSSDNFKPLSAIALPILARLTANAVTGMDNAEVELRRMNKAADEKVRNFDQVIRRVRDAGEQQDRNGGSSCTTKPASKIG